MGYNFKVGDQGRRLLRRRLNILKKQRGELGGYIEHRRASQAKGTTDAKVLRQEAVC